MKTKYVLVIVAVLFVAFSGVVTILIGMVQLMREPGIVPAAIIVVGFLILLAYEYSKKGVILLFERWRRSDERLSAK